MTQSARKVRRLMESAGLQPPDQLTVERTYAGRVQRSIGWCVWIARNESGRIVCGSGYPIRDLQVGNVCVFRRDASGEPEIGPAT